MLPLVDDYGEQVSQREQRLAMTIDGAHDEDRNAVMGCLKLLMHMRGHRMAIVPTVPSAGVEDIDALLGDARERDQAVVYRDDVPIDVAKDDLNSVWIPNGTWRKFIFDVFEENGRSPDCDSCLWESD